MSVKPLAVALCALVLSACAVFAPAEPPAGAALDAPARDYVLLTLRIGEHEPGYVDAYHGPAEWAEAAKADPKTLPELTAEARRLRAAVRAVDPLRLQPIERRRRAFLEAHLRAAEARIAMIGGDRPAFADEAEALFGVRPELKPLSSYDPVLAEIETLVPGDGPLAERVDRFRGRFTVPADRLDAVMRAAIDECRRRTLAHIRLPQDETFTMEFVTGKPWSGYNWYQGGHTSLIQINVELPVGVGRAVDLGCHEGYPGHHTHNVLMEDRLARGRGWVEFTVFPLFSPVALIAEGSSNYGIELAFPGEERLTFEREVLYPLAGLDPATADDLLALDEATQALSGARYTIAADYLAGRIDRETALALTRRYGLTSPARAEQSLKFVDTYRSYVINYGLGRDLVRAHVQRAGPDQKARWAAMERLLSEPSIPLDLER